MSAAAGCALEPGLGPLATLLFREPFHLGPRFAFVAVGQRGIGIVF